MRISKRSVIWVFVIGVLIVSASFYFLLKKDSTSSDNQNSQSTSTSNESPIPFNTHVNTPQDEISGTTEKNYSSKDNIKIDAVTPSQYISVKNLSPANITDISLNDFVNRERLNKGLRALTLNAKLNQSALDKCNDMVSKDYWSHNTPDGNAPWRFITGSGYQYQTAGENLAVGFIDSSGVVAGWMNSKEHRENLLLPEYRDAGYGVCKSEHYVGTHGLPSLIVVQHLGRPR